MTQVRIPLDRKGNQIDGYVREDDTRVGRWLEIEELTDTLTLLELAKCSSSVKGRFQDSQGRTFFMFLTDFNRLFKKHGLPIDGRAIHGTFGFVERSSFIGIYLKT